MGGLAEWHTPRVVLQLVLDEQRAGGSLVTIWVPDARSAMADLASRGGPEVELDCSRLPPRSPRNLGWTQASRHETWTPVMLANAPEEIPALLAAAMNAGDLDAFIGLHESEASSTVPIDGRSVSGRDGFSGPTGEPRKGRRLSETRAPKEVSMNIGREDDAIVIEPIEDPVTTPAETPVTEPVREPART